MKKEYSKDNPHKDIGKQKFRVRKAYTAWVEYDVVADSKDEAIDAVIEQGGIDHIKWSEGYHNDEPVEVYAQDYNSDATEPFEAVKVAECVPYEDSDSIDYEDATWSSDDYEWKKTGDEEPVETKKSDMEVPF
tara:strand:- start:16 stop:414 length:399 start_codon:yes stop_codon:yes gene_type:complete